MKSSKILKFIFLGFFVLMVVLVPTKTAQAIPFLGSIINFTSDAISRVLYVVAWVFAQVGGVIFAFASYLANWVLGLNYDVYAVNIAEPALSKNVLVSVGWRIARDVTNLGFVLVIIIIALATILRREEYGVQKLLPKLIAAAILVNFSLTIAGVFVDFSHVLTKFFFDRVSLNGSGGIADVLAGAFQPQALFQTEQEAALTGATAGNTLATAFLNLVFIIIFTLIGAFTILSFAFLLLLRYLYLSFLGVIAPIVWLFWVIPQLSSQFGKWWSSFLRWTFFAPASAFFMYLALSALISLDAINNPDAAAVIGGVDPTLKGILAKGANMIVVAGMMLGGLIIADKMGVKGASGAMALGGKLSSGAKGWMGAKTASGLQGIRDRALTAGTSKDPQGRSWAEKAAGTLRGIPVIKSLGIGALGRGISAASSNAKANLKKRATDKMKDLENETPENVLSRAQAAAGGIGEQRIESPADMAAMAIMVAKKGNWSKLTTEEQSRMKDALKTSDMASELLKYRPELAGEFEPPQDKAESNANYRDRIEKAIEKAVGKLEDPVKLDANTLETIAPHLRPGQLEKIGKEGSIEQKKKIKERLENIVNETNAQAVQGIEYLEKGIKDFVKEIDDEKARGGPQSQTKIDQLIKSRKVAKQKLDQLIGGLSDKQKQALEKRRSVSENIAWRQVFP